MTATSYRVPFVLLAATNGPKHTRQMPATASLELYADYPPVDPYRTTAVGTEGRELSCDAYEDAEVISLI